MEHKLCENWFYRLQQSLFNFGKRSILSHAVSLAETKEISEVKNDSRTSYLSKTKQHDRRCNDKEYS